MSITDDEYNGLRGFLGYFFDNVVRMKLAPEHHPVAVLDRSSSSLPKTKVRQGLQMAINDCLEMSADFSVEQVRAIDTGLASAGLPTLSGIRNRFWRRIQSALKRGRIRGEVEYYAIRNAAEVANDPVEGSRLRAMIAEFETRSRPRRRSG